MRKNAKFDREQVIDKATNLYWEKGFHATSMRNLQDVIDMRPGSIYAAFGSKEGLFKEALTRYTQAGIAQLVLSRASANSPIAALTAFMKLMIIENRGSAPSAMCMLAKTVAELTDEHLELLETAKQSLKTMEHEFEKLIIEAQSIGEVSKDKDAKQLARHIQVQISGLRTYSRTCDDDAPLSEMIDDIFAHYPF
ncbi:TetR/AcrR family transcriptional regulator [Shewanella abyssi]|uniref:TetR/AcrR family transcriptional regulator n=1 Tax=Shewanella abyssi TaxID=311789 RepID=UPI00200FBCF3|nr:TetR/AcrR family transcriptional regulator [Shewanella abyssi]MCL1051480.1 TetR/AcrR family transcriptional regulator [Shewanella abyssi]